MNFKEHITIEGNEETTRRRRQRRDAPGVEGNIPRPELQEMQEEGTLSSHMQVSNGEWG